MNQDLHAGSLFRVIPVLDLRGGQVVQARGGDRSAYPGLKTQLCSGNDPVDVALAFRDVLGLDSLYVADLDAIEHDRPDLTTLNRLAQLRLDLWVDLGLRRSSQLRDLSRGDSLRTILATETLPGMDLVREAIRDLGRDRVVLGLDLKAGHPILSSTWREDHNEPMTIIQAALEVGVRRVLLLDIDRVGTGLGLASLELVAMVRSRYSDLEITVGGGVTSPLDLKTARATGASGILVGSALYDGRIGPEDLRGV
jgi:phosphoribosylformimino-5-aminoimidazole carboxamide ribotide isomerase